MEFKITSEKYGEQTGLIDAQDYYLLEKYAWCLWTTKRHNTFYVRRFLTRRNDERLHRRIMNAQPGQIVDHINGNGLDNRRCNLRITNSHGNNCNSAKRKNSTSKYKGVSWSSREKKWKAQIQENKRKRPLGTYVSEEQAARVYDKAALQLHGEFAKINFNKEDYT